MTQTIVAAMLVAICSACFAWTLPVERALPEYSAPSEFDVDGALEEKDGQREHRNGVLLRSTKASVVESEQGPVLRVEWELSYNGKRWPLVILEPNLERETNAQTHLVIFAHGKSKQGYRIAIRSPSRPGSTNIPYYSDPSWFIEIPKGKGKATGLLETEFGPIKEAFVKGLPKEFSADVTPDLYIRLEHYPEDRAEYLHLDPWTGDLLTAARKVDIKKW